MQHKIAILVGPLPSPVTGQSIAFKALVDNYKYNKKVFDYNCNKEHFFYFLIKNLSVVLSFFVYCLLNKKNISSVYITTSRSNVGFFRDFALISTAALFSLTIINHLHGADFKRFRAKNNILKVLIDFIYIRISASIVLCDSMKEQYDCYENMKLVTIPNFHDLTDKSTIVHKSTNHFKVLYLSNVMYSKGIFHLIDSVKALVDNGFNIQLDIAGAVMADLYMAKDESEKLLLEKIKNCNYIKFHGAVYGPKKTYLLENASVFCLPSFYPTEAQPISIIEAMATGCFIITTDHNYLPDLVSQKEGLVIKKDNQEAISDALKFTYENPAVLKGISKHNVEHAEKNYSLSTYIHSITEVIHI